MNYKFYRMVQTNQNVYVYDGKNNLYGIMVNERVKVIEEDYTGTYNLNIVNMSKYYMELKLQNI